MVNDINQVRVKNHVEKKLKKKKNKKKNRKKKEQVGVCTTVD